jgi:hypothetical protein
MRVRAFELRLLATALVVCWTIAAGLILLAYRPGGPFDVLVGLTAILPIVIALAAVVWPPVARGDVAFPAIVWLGILAILCLVPSITGVVTQLLVFGSRTLLPSLEAIYPWLLALLATSLFSGFGVARRLHGGTSMRRRRLLLGTALAAAATAISGLAFAAVAVTNDIAIRDMPVTDSRFGPVVGADEPPPCDETLTAGANARLHLEMAASVDFRSIGQADLTGLRVGDDFRWLTFVAGDREIGRYGKARIGDTGWIAFPGTSWLKVSPSTVAADTVDIRALNAALTPGIRATAEDRGVEVIEGARARRCRVSVDGDIFREAFPEISSLVGDADLHRWRSQLDYWVFLDGQLGQVVGSANGEGAGIVPEALIGTIDVRMTATERWRDAVVYPPGP